MFSRHEPETFASKYDPGDYDDDSLHRPSSLLEHINAATRSAIIGAGLESPHSGEGKSEEQPRSPITDENEQAAFPRAVGDVSRPAHVRYSFDGEGEGELRVSSGNQVVVLDDRDAE